MRGAYLLVPLLVGCGGEDGPSAQGASTGDTARATSSTSPAPLQGGCAVQSDNVLRYDCVFHLAEPAPLTLAVSGGSRGHTLQSTEPSEQHAFTVVLLKPGTPYDWTVDAGSASLSGSFTTSALPPEVDLRATVTGVGTTDSIVIPFQCGAPGHLVAIDALGEVEWYQDMTSSLDGDDLDGLALSGFDATPESVIGLLHHSHITEFDWSGTSTGSASQGTDYTLPTHHSVHRSPGRRYVLNADTHLLPDGNYLLDGVYVFDADWSPLGEWSLREALTPSGGGPAGGYWGAEFPGAIDYSHTNSIHVDENLDWILSMRGLNTVIKVRGDLGAPDFGALIWSLSSSALSPLGSDYLVTSSQAITPQMDFSDQHHAHVEADGGLWLFDNRAFGENSRGIRMRLEDAYGVADIERVVTHPERSAEQSSVYLLPNDHTLLTCANSQTLYEYAPASTEPVWTATLSCPEGNRAPLTLRGQPVFWESDQGSR